MTTTDAGTRGEVRSEARGRHWVAWVPDGAGKPINAVVLVAETQEEAERRAREWARMTGR